MQSLKDRMWVLATGLGCGLLGFGVLMILGLGESRTGAISYSSPVPMLIGSFVAGVVMARRSHSKRDLPDLLILLSSALFMGSLMVSGTQGGCDLRGDFGPCESIFTFGQSAILVYGLFTIGGTVGLISRLIWRVRRQRKTSWV